MKPNCPSELLQQHRHPQEEPTGPGGRELAEQALGCCWSNGAAILSMVIIRNSLRMGSLLCGGTGNSFLGRDSRGAMANGHPLTIPGSVQN